MRRWRRYGSTLLLDPLHRLLCGWLPSCPHRQVGDVSFDYLLGLQCCSLSLRLGNTLSRLSQVSADISRDRPSLHCSLERSRLSWPLGGLLSPSMSVTFRDLLGLSCRTLNLRALSSRAGGGSV